MLEIHYIKNARNQKSIFDLRWAIGPTQVKCQLLISSIFEAMNFQHFLEMLEIHWIKNATVDI